MAEGEALELLNFFFNHEYVLILEKKRKGKEKKGMSNSN